MLLLFTAASAAQAQNGPVGYWKGDDGSSPTQALNSVSGVKDGTYTASATTSASAPTLLFPNPSSMSFNGSTAYVNVPSFTWPAGGGPTTVSFWNFVATAQNSSAFTVGSQDAPNRFQVHAPWGDGSIYFDYGDYNATGRISTSYTAKLNKWTHVALVSAGNGGSFKAIYLDGALAVSSSTASAGPTTQLTGLQIGAWSSASCFHNGQIDDFRIYSRMLTATEIGALAAGNTEPAAPTGLIATASINQNPGQVDLVWNAVSGATSYNLKWGTSPGSYPNVIPLTGTTYSHTSLTVNVTYWYVVSAVNSLGQSPDSVAVSARPTPPPRTSVVGNENDPCGCGVASGSGWRPLACGLAALAALALVGRQRTVPKAILR
jgi:hypothetical protein